MSYSLSLANSISDVCRILAETEREFVSLERILEYNSEFLMQHDFVEYVKELEFCDFPVNFLRGQVLEKSASKKALPNFSG